MPVGPCLRIGRQEKTCQEQLRGQKLQQGLGILQQGLGILSWDSSARSLLAGSVLPAGGTQRGARRQPAAPKQPGMQRVFGPLLHTSTGR